MSPPDHASRLLRLERALAGSRDGYWERDLRGDSIWYSSSFYELFKITPADLPSQRGAATARVHPEDRERFRATYAQALKTLGAFDYEVRILHGDGQWRWVYGRGQVWAGSDGKPHYLCGTVSDVHREKMAQFALEQQRAQLEQQVRERTARLESALAEAEERRRQAERANAAKSMFLAHMSHEIRTPLNGVLGLTELAQRVADTPELTRYLDAAHRSGQALLQVITDVLDFSRIEAGGIDLRPHAFDLPNSLAESLRGVMPLIRGRRISMLFDWEGEHEWVLGDERCIRQIVTNLVANAVKFTEKGYVSLVGRSWPEPGGRLGVEVRIEDTGPGVPPEQRDHIFAPFAQGDESLSRRHGGTGLGLAIARELTRAMGGELRLDGDTGAGARFVLTLSLPAAEPGVGAPPPLPPVAVPRLVWLVYPLPEGSAWMRRRFEQLQCRTVLWPDVAAAVAAASSATAPRPDLVLIAQPALQGAQVLNELRAVLPQTVIHLAIRPDWFDPALETQARALGIGASVTPYTPRILRELLGSRMGLAAPLPGNSMSPRAGAEVLLVEDNPVNQLIGQEFLRALGLQVSLATNGHEALEACRSHAPALVLMDLQMPEMDGLEAARRLQQMQAAGLWPGAPIVALTAHASEADRLACHAAGMVGMMTKPLALESLRAELARWLPA